MTKPIQLTYFYRVVFLLSCTPTLFIFLGHLILKQDVLKILLSNESISFSLVIFSVQSSLLYKKILETVKDTHFSFSVNFIAVEYVAEWLRHRSRQQNVPSSIPGLGISVEVTSYC